MCGILAILDIKNNSDELRSRALEMVKKIRHRGPDWSGVFSDDHAVLAHERLSIVDVETGAQPLYNTQTGAVLAVNGEIYNHRELHQKKLNRNHDWQTKSDCEVILYLYEEYGTAFLNQLNGIFAFVLYDPKKQTYLVARDHMGIIPLYMGWDEKGHLYIASEMKALIDTCNKIQEFPAGHLYEGTAKELTCWYHPEWMDTIPEKRVDLAELREALEAAVKRQLMCDVPYGLLISGGVDSSIIAAIAAKYSQRRVESDDYDAAWWPRMHSFSVGLKGSPDLAAAKKVADHIGTVHHEVYFTVQEGLDAIRDVIYHLETFDVTTIRAATPMYLMSRKIKAFGIKMILSGEGADEIFGGYLYFHKAPNAVEFHEELVRKLSALHLYDCLRANKSTAAWGLEARVPFLDKEFMDVAMNINPEDKLCGGGKVEKGILRQAFEGYVPSEILWRQKEQFSDGVGYSWIDNLKDIANETVTDEMLAEADHRFRVKPPRTKEEYRYRTIFEEFFPLNDAAECIPVGPSIACSTPTAIRWDASFANMADPSGRAVLNVHQDGVDHI
ncbi:MAG: asparagine synthase B [Spartobacteria bacterium]|nr:asparagine synthase B [Spartobacteria bacterium]